MKPISNWNEIQENNNSYKKLTTGGKVCAIKNVTDYPDKQYLRIEYDIVRGEEKGYFTKMYENDTRENKRWRGVLIRSYKDTALSMFKGFTTSIEKSNRGYKWNWDEQSLVRKYFGAVFAEEEYINNNGGKSVRTYIAQVHSVETIEKGEFMVPEIKRLSNVASETPKKEYKDIDEYFGEGKSLATSEVEKEVQETPKLTGFDDDDDDPFK